MRCAAAVALAAWSKGDPELFVFAFICECDDPLRGFSHPGIADVRDGSRPLRSTNVSERLRVLAEALTRVVLVHDRG